MEAVMAHHDDDDDDDDNDDDNNDGSLINALELDSRVICSWAENFSLIITQSAIYSDS